ncbi:phospholipid-transporting atpase iib-like protein [Dermatophagoides farinae]|uniref:Phospholipid-transporting atpase iib-like protein n=1 Tax=Dermatophagoides farinae TaxID=6954 RepID=A0A9D4SHI4_DERFA|nr:phospholipid-transporting atpase iib-like protein [Dermatophagoides farinae]
MKYIDDRLGVNGLSSSKMVLQDQTSVVDHNRHDHRSHAFVKSTPTTTTLSAKYTTHIATTVNRDCCSSCSSGSRTASTTTNTVSLFHEINNSNDINKSKLNHHQQQLVNHKSLSIIDSNNASKLINKNRHHFSSSKSSSSSSLSSKKIFYLSKSYLLANSGKIDRFGLINALPDAEISSKNYPYYNESVQFEQRSLLLDKVVDIDGESSDSDQHHQQQQTNNNIQVSKRIEQLINTIFQNFWSLPTFTSNNHHQQQRTTTVSSVSSEESGLGSTESAALLRGVGRSGGSRVTTAIHGINTSSAAIRIDPYDSLATTSRNRDPETNDYPIGKKIRNGRNKSRSSTKNFFHFIFCGLCMAWSECFSRIFRFILRKKSLKPRIVHVRSSEDRYRKNEFPPNIVRNQKYTILTFLPIVLFNQFKFFLNLYFLLMACSQFIPALAVGPIFTYWAPLGFVLGVTLIREMVDDLLRYKRDKAVNSQFYMKLTSTNGTQAIPSAKIRVGDIILVGKDQRVPADMIFLRTSEKNGACFIRTDQLDGETDWKLRLALTTTQELDNNEDIFELDAVVNVEEPRRDIHSFVGKFVNISNGKEVPLSIENTFWANTVVASGTAIGIVIYTGPETRSMMNNNEPRSKVGLLDYEVNELTKLLFAAVVILAFAMICLKGFSAYWYIYWFRYVLLFSYIIPISLRVNLEMGRVVYCQMIQRDMEIAGTLARTTTIPEDLGRIAYLLTDKTGTLTKNEMIFKKIHFGRISYNQEYFDEVTAILRAYYNPTQVTNSGAQTGQPVSNYQTHRRESSTASTSSFTFERRRCHMRIDSYEVDREIVYRVQQSVLAIALCHNVTPAYENQFETGGKNISDFDQDQNSISIPMKDVGIMYHASSPDEVALYNGQKKLESL